MSVSPEKAAYMKIWRAANAERLKEWRRQAYAKNKEREAAGIAAYYAKNAERLRAAAKARREQNPDACDAAQRRWREKNADAIRAAKKARRDATPKAARKLKDPSAPKRAKKAWKQRNPGQVVADKARRRARQLQATMVWADRALMDDIYALAAIYTRAGFPAHVDHVVPLRSKRVCGLHVPANLSVLPAVDNIRKGNRWWPDMPGS